MPSKKKRAPRIPPGAPGHPRGEADEKRPRAPRPERRKREAAKLRPDLAGSVAKTPSRASARLLYEDESILAFDKPVGLPVIAPEGSRARCLLDIATEEVARKKPKGRAAVVHRIDRDSSGVVVFAADGKTKKLLMEGWDELVTKRLYVALVAGSMAEGSGVFDSWLKENKAGEVYRAEPEERGAKRAVTRWRRPRGGLGTEPPRARAGDRAETPDPRPARGLRAPYSGRPTVWRRRSPRPWRARRRRRDRPGTPLSPRPHDRTEASRTRGPSDREPGPARIRIRRREAPAIAQS